MKPTVHYRGVPYVVANHAWLTPIDHPNHVEGQDVSNMKNVRTSTVLSYDTVTGRIETLNTVYMPEKEH